MHDIKFIREFPEKFDDGMKKRGLEPQAKKILELDEKKRSDITRLQDLQKKRNELAKAVGMAKAKGENAEPILAEGKKVGEELTALEKQTGEGGELENLLAGLPNIPADDVPVGEEEDANKEIRKWGSPKKFSFKPQQHFDIGEKLGYLNFDQTAKISGARFATLSGPLARLERALAAFMLDMHTKEFGFTEVAPPFLVKDNAMYGSGQLPKFGEDSFSTTNGYRLIPTSEVSLVNMVSDMIIDEVKLPIRYTAFTPCFRSEAGSAGRDTRGLIRMHQFAKVELVAITHPDKSEEEHQRIVSMAEQVLQRLGLPYRVVLLSSMAGFTNKKTYDLEVWLPGQDAYREISSCSNCGDFQARRMKSRFKKTGEKETTFVHTLNGSALAVGRTIVAILENYQNEDGSVTVPEALKEYMGGLEVIK